ncbi:DUF2809 domain-containing protein [Ornithinibacillus sp. 179-J 7C1 HS]|uniref:ribosomal maturation YjgA family protein n=1 Tax=Ornithinibacillus sp. 179-J 7C1 HS TaxID=3142384 RepID=UPI0039A0DCC5
MTISNQPNSFIIRLPYLLALIVTILLGLVSRIYGEILPAFLSENAGDTFWAMMVYFGFRFLLVRHSLRVSILLSFVFSFGIEFSQIYQADWINQIRSTTIGALVLGKGFLVVDLVRYSVGIILAMLINKLGLLIWNSYKK